MNKPKSPVLKPLFIWTGGKRKVIPEFRARNLLPSYKQFDSYVEPFFGGGAVFCDVVNSGFTKEFVINDINTEMMFVYYWIREAPDAFIKECERLIGERNGFIDKAGRKGWYAALSKKYWGMNPLKNYPNAEPKTLITAATLYALMLTNFNGLWQVSKKNDSKFGTAVGLWDKKCSIDADLINSWSKVLARARLFSGSYQDIEIPAGHALIYVDPPYRGSTMTYGRSFTDSDQADLVQWCFQKSLQNHTVIFSNRELFDNFFRILFCNDEDQYVHFKHSYLKGTKAEELVVVLEPERLKRSQILINGEVVTLSNWSITRMLRQNPILKEFGITPRGLFEAQYTPKKGS
jgi:DNA adenine methylase